MDKLIEHWKVINDSIPEGVLLVTVSKKEPVEIIKELYRGGVRVFGENRVQDLVEKEQQLPKDIEWHMIGHLQSNKVKYIAPFVTMIHSVESQKLLETINREGAKVGRVIPCLLQFHIADEETKFGLDIEEAHAMLKGGAYKTMENVRIEGVMGMATFSDDKMKVRKEFCHLREIFNTLKDEYFKDDPLFKELSMGMSGDYKIAIEEGSTMVRVGSLIFENI